MRRLRSLLFVIIIALCGILPYGCVDDFDDLVLEEPGVLQHETTYWVGDVMVTQRETMIRSYDWVTHHFRGSVKNYGTAQVVDARFEILTADETGDREGNVRYEDEGVGATQEMGTLAPQQEQPINLSYSYPSVAHRRIRGQFTSN